MINNTNNNDDKHKDNGKNHNNNNDNNNNIITTTVIMVLLMITHDQFSSTDLPQVGQDVLFEVELNKTGHPQAWPIGSDWNRLEWGDWENLIHMKKQPEIYWRCRYLI